MNDSISIANRFIQLAREDGKTLTIMQILKLVYIAHGWHLGLCHEPLISDEVQAWQYGPVVPKLYQALRHYRTRPVEREIPARKSGVLNPSAEDIIRQVYKLYGRLPGPALSRITHVSGSPWTQVYEPGSFGTVIPDDLIEDYYAGLAKTLAVAA